MPASDVYSAGIVLFELLTGAPPYAGEPLAVLRGHLDQTPQRPAGLPSAVWELVEWCLAKDPEQRPTTAELGAALRELSRATAGVPALPAAGDATVVTGGTAQLGLRAVSHPSVRPVSSRKRPRNGPRSWMWRRPWMISAVLAATVALSGLGGFNAWQLLNSGDSPAVAAPQASALPSGRGTIGAGARPSASSRPGALPPAPPLSGQPGELPAGPGLPGRPDLSGGPAAPAGTGEGAGRPAEPTAAAGISAGPVGVGASAGPGGGRVEANFGPWRCGDEYEWDFGHPVLARPCHAVGGGVRVVGQMEAMPGLQLDISLTLRDAAGDDVVAGPYTCKALMFTDFALKHSCGPVDFQPPRGRQLVLVQTWEYTQRPLIPGGKARGPVFSW